MPKVKNIAGPAAAGFILSFLISIFVTHNFGVSFLKGLLFGAIFAVLAFVIDFVWGRFLSDGSEPVELASESPRTEKGLGARVDITIDDADLSDDGRGLPFAVDRNRAKLSEADTQDLRKNDVLFAAESKGEKQSLFDRTPEPVKKPDAAPAASEPAAESQGTFTPVSLGKPLPASAAAPASHEAAASPAAASSAGPAKAAPAPARKASSGDGELDGLPDIGGFDTDDNYVSESDMEEDGSAGESPSSYSSPASSSSVDASKATAHDTETLAKAISTVLKRDEMS